MRIVGAIFIFALAGCAGLSRQACLDMDWRAVGYADGARGARQDAASLDLRRCARKEASALDMSAYRAGWRDGLQVYCTPDNGYAAGRRGEEAGELCDEAGEGGAAFKAAYAKGRGVFELEAAIAAAGRRINAAEGELWDIKLRLAEVESALASPAMTNDERRELLDERAHLKREVRRIEESVVSLNQLKRSAQTDLAAVEQEAAGGVTQPTSVSY